MCCLTGPHCLTLAREDTGSSLRPEPGPVTQSPNIFHPDQKNCRHCRFIRPVFNPHVQPLLPYHHVSVSLYLMRSFWVRVRDRPVLWTLSCEYQVASNSYASYVSPSIRHPGSYFSSRLSISCMLSLTEEDMSEALPCRSPNEAQLNIRTNEVREQNIFQHPPEKLSCLSELETRILMSGSEAFG